MAYEVAWHTKVRADLAAIAKPDASRIIAKAKEHLTRDPSGSGKPLKGLFKGLHRLRVGAYRVIYAIDHEERRVLVLHVQHRKDVYRE